MLPFYQFFNTTNGQFECQNINLRSHHNIVSVGWRIFEVFFDGFGDLGLVFVILCISIITVQQVSNSSSTLLSLVSIEAHNGKALVTVSTLNSLKETKLASAMNCHRIVILHNEKMNNEKMTPNFLSDWWFSSDSIINIKILVL